MKKVLIYLTLIPALLTGCMKDKGTYDYRAVNKPVVEALLDVDGRPVESVTAPTMSVLTLTPVITESVENTGDQYAYRWYIYRLNGSAVDISDERELEWVVTAMPGRYTGMYVVTNQSNEVSTSYQFTLEVVKANTGNLMIANNVDGTARLTLLTNQGEWIEDAFELANGTPAGSDAVYVANGRLFGAVSGDNSVLLCDDGEGGSYFSNSSYEQVYSYRDLFYEAPQTVRPQAYYRGYGNYEYFDQLDFIVNDGGLHYRLATMVDGGARFGVRMAGDYSLCPVAICHQGTFLFYDNKNMRFCNIVDNSYGDEIDVRMESAFYYLSFWYNPAVIEAWDPDNVGLEMLYFMSTDQDMGYAVMRDPANPADLYRLKFFAGGLGFIDYSGANGGFQNYWNSFWKRPIATTNYLSEATCFTAARNYAFIYYAVGSKVYLYDVENDSNKLILDVAETLPGNTVDCIYIQNLANNMFDESLNRRMFVAASPAAGGGRTGSILDVRLMVNGEYESHTVHRDVVGKVVSMDHQM